MNNAGCGPSILHFEIRLAGEVGPAGAIYNNGRHQCHVIIEVVKGIKDGQGVWRAIELTEEDLDSVTVTAFSNDPDVELPEGWSCERQRNIFDLGLWNRAEKKEVVERVEKDFIFGCKVERVSRYICVEPTAPLKAVRLMARMTLSGQVYTTSLSGGEFGIESSVTVEPVCPYVLKVADLTEYRDDPALLEGGVYGVCYYWMPPAGVTFTLNSGLSMPLRFSGEGDFFQTSYVHSFNSDVGFKGGVVVHKDIIGLQLRLNDVHHGYHYPHNNPFFRFNERPTIMRAIVLTDKMPALQTDSRSVWVLWDNFGNRHGFKLVQDGQYRMRLEDVIELPSETNVKTFRIFLDGDQIETNALYANGRHQCKIGVEVLKEVMSSDGGWVEEALTETERESLTIVPYSDNDHAQLPPGWGCDKERNIFDMGLWRRGAELQELDVNKPLIVDGSKSELLYRYMRVDPTIPIESHRFMARIIVGGKIYTTKKITGNTFVTISPVRPYIVRASELTRNIHEPYYSADTSTDVDVYYWGFPSGLRVVVNKGLDTPIAMRNEGYRFQTSYSVRRIFSYVKVGVVMGSDDLNVRVLLSDIHRNLLDNNVGIYFSQFNSIMRAVRISSGIIEFDRGDARTPWRIWDNFGCEHAFYLFPGSDGHSLSLGDIN